MKNPTLDVTVLRAVFGAVSAAVYAIVDFDVRRAVYVAVEDAVGRAVNWEVHGAIFQREELPHPGLALYLAG